MEIDLEVKLEAGLRSHEQRNTALGALLRPGQTQCPRELNDDRKAPPEPLSATGYPNKQTPALNPWVPWKLSESLAIMHDRGCQRLFLHGTNENPIDEAWRQVPGALSGVDELVLHQLVLAHALLAVDTHAR
jgi:hypothetical protein